MGIYFGHLRVTNKQVRTHTDTDMHAKAKIESFTQRCSFLEMLSRFTVKHSIDILSIFIQCSLWGLVPEACVQSEGDSRFGLLINFLCDAKQGHSEWDLLCTLEEREVIKLRVAFAF